MWCPAILPFTFSKYLTFYLFTLKAGLTTLTYTIRITVAANATLYCVACDCFHCQSILDKVWRHKPIQNNHTKMNVFPDA